MLRFSALIISLSLTTLSSPADDLLIDAMEHADFRPIKDKVTTELAPGKVGQAVQFSFAKDCSGAFAAAKQGAKPNWDQAQGFSFWVKGDGSQHLGGIELVWNGDFSLRLGYAFPIDSTEWKKITVPWRDLLPETSKSAALPIDPERGNAPSKLGPLWFGKWWYWRDYEAHSYAIDEIRLEPTIELDASDYRPTDAPLARTLAKLTAGQKLKIVTMGDSLTDYKHWANRMQNWPGMLKALFESQHQAQVEIVNPAIGGTELRQNLVLLPRWSAPHADADLVVVCFGGNDWNSGMRGPLFQTTCEGAVDRIRRATRGHADVLLVTTCPSLDDWDTRAELAGAVRQASQLKNACLADLYAAFHLVEESERPGLFVNDKVHLSPMGHRLFADTVAKAVERGGSGSRLRFRGRAVGQR